MFTLIHKRQVELQVHQFFLHCVGGGVVNAINQSPISLTQMTCKWASRGTQYVAHESTDGEMDYA